MVHCFVHAPTTKDWEGILLLHLEKQTGVFREKEVRKIFEKEYPEDDFYQMNYDPNPSESQVAEFELRCAKGMMQRMTLVKSYEDLTFRQWRKILATHYPNKEKFVQMIRKFSSYEEEPTQ